MYVWSIESDEALLKQDNIHNGFIYLIESVGDNKFVTCGGDEGKIKIWEDLKVV